MASNTLFVSNFPFATTEDELRATFQAFGDVNSIRIILDRETGRSRGFAFVEMADGDAADAAIERLNDTEFHGRRLVVSRARGRAGADGGMSAAPSSGRFPRQGQGGATSSSPPFRHRIVIDWSDEDEAYVATVPDLGVSAQAATIDGAVRQVQSRARDSMVASHAG
jgi:RNA recognition motif-containing protein